MNTLNNNRRAHREFATGAIADDAYGELSVAVPHDGHGNATRNAARVFARSIWGPTADLARGPWRGPVTGRDVDGRAVMMRRYVVTIVTTSTADAYMHGAMAGLYA